MKENWDSSILFKYLLPYLETHSVKALLTFDFKGVSGHLNHIALPLTL